MSEEGSVVKSAAAVVRRKVGRPAGPRPCEMPYLGDLTAEERKARVNDLAKTRKQIHAVLRQQHAEELMKLNTVIERTQARVAELEKELHRARVAAHIRAKRDRELLLEEEYWEECWSP